PRCPRRGRQRPLRTPPPAREQLPAQLGATPHRTHPHAHAASQEAWNTAGDNLVPWVIDRLAALVGPVRPGFAVEVVMDPVDIALGAGVFPMARPVPAHAGPDVARVVIVVKVGDPALIAGANAGAVIVYVKCGALRRQWVGTGQVSVFELHDSEAGRAGWRGAADAVLRVVGLVGHGALSPVAFLDRHRFEDVSI